MSDRVVLMNEGVIEQVGAPQELYTTPATEFAARFIGANNLVAGRFIGGTTPAAKAESLPLTVAAGSRAPGVGGSDQPVWICIRPEHIRVEPRLDETAETSPPRLHGRLTDVVFQGTSVLLEAEVGGVGPVRAECPPAEVAQLRPGEEVTMTLLNAHLVPRAPGGASQASGTESRMPREDVGR
jgi:ABC-type Fe3+/spermidine/putrescine transport system ATPase subunit